MPGIGGWCTLHSRQTILKINTFKTYTQVTTYNSHETQKMLSIAVFVLILIASVKLAGFVE